MVKDGDTRIGYHSAGHARELGCVTYLRSTHGISQNALRETKLKLSSLATSILMAATSAIAPASAHLRKATPAASADVEEIYIARSVRESRATPTEFCAKERTGISDATIEDQYSLRSVATRTSDGRALDSDVSTIGSVHACFGRTENSTISEFYGQILLGSTALKGFGECKLAKSNFPEQGMTVFRCFLDLSSLSGKYIGGQLTSNTVVSRKPIGTESDPAGYTQPSIATIRLWRKRDGH
jgi:hypothetical protein